MTCNYRVFSLSRLEEVAYFVRMDCTDWLGSDHRRGKSMTNQGKPWHPLQLVTNQWSNPGTCIESPRKTPSPECPARKKNFTPAKESMQLLVYSFCWAIFAQAAYYQPQPYAGNYSPQPSLLSGYGPQQQPPYNQQPFQQQQQASMDPRMASAMSLRGDMHRAKKEANSYSPSAPDLPEPTAQVTKAGDWAKLVGWPGADVPPWIPPPTCNTPGCHAQRVKVEAFWERKILDPLRHSLDTADHMPQPPRSSDGNPWLWHDYYRRFGDLFCRADYPLPPVDADKNAKKSNRFWLGLLKYGQWWPGNEPPASETPKDHLKGYKDWLGEFKRCNGGLCKAGKALKGAWESVKGFFKRGKRGAKRKLGLEGDKEKQARIEEDRKRKTTEAMEDARHALQGVSDQTAGNQQVGGPSTAFYHVGGQVAPYGQWSSSYVPGSSTSYFYQNRSGQMMPQQQFNGQMSPYSAYLLSLQHQKQPYGSNTAAYNNYNGYNGYGTNLLAARQPQLSYSTYSSYPPPYSPYSTTSANSPYAYLGHHSTYGPVYGSYSGSNLTGHGPSSAGYSYGASTNLNPANSSSTAPCRYFIEKGGRMIEVSPRVFHEIRKGSQSQAALPAYNTLQQRGAMVQRQLLYPHQ